jgi:hypothetical protein
MKIALSGLSKRYHSRLLNDNIIRDCSSQWTCKQTEKYIYRRNKWRRTVGLSDLLRDVGRKDKRPNWFFFCPGYDTSSQT